MRIMLCTILAVAPVLCGCGDSEPMPGAPLAPALTLTVGHVGHDHQLALYLAALEGTRFQKDFGICLKEVKRGEVYDLIEGDTTLARLRLLKVGGGARMPAAMSRGELDIGLGGVAAVAKYADQGQPFRIIAPLQTDGDMLVMRTGSPIGDWDAFVAATKSGGEPLKIGYKAPVAVAKLVFVGALKAANIPFGYDPADRNARVILVNMMSEKSPLPLLESGSIDGFVMNQPAVSVAVHKGLGHVVAELRDLPPKGKWVDHPCCCVSATDETLRKHPEAVKAFLKVILLSTQVIRQEPELAIDAATKWIKNPRDVEADSVPHISYVAEPSKSWMRAMGTWVTLMQDVEAFNGAYACISAADVLQDVCRFDLLKQAAADLRAKKLLE